MLSLVIAQLCLGFTAFLTRVAWGRDAVQPELPMVVSTVAHVAVGALLLATTVDSGDPGVADMFRSRWRSECRRRNGTPPQPEPVHLAQQQMWNHWVFVGECRMS